MFYSVKMLVVQLGIEKPFVTIEGPDFDVVHFFVLLNSPSPQHAIDLACEIGENSYDRDGSYIGGLIQEVTCRRISKNEFEGFENQFINAPTSEGVFFVSGVTLSSIVVHDSVFLTREIERRKQFILGSGIPEPCFFHPHPAKAQAETMRVVCPVCWSWIESDSNGFLYSFFEGMDAFSFPDQFDEASESVREIQNFLEKHIGCINGDNQNQAIKFLNESSTEYDRLDPALKE